ncbi:hypothetical protein [Edaphobacter sp. HDX4]|uniref:hypothetical protein n=1 Tax=Edaphobacter sp. HDX4 TaxID=2794064 RepID=UPI002FE5B50C
MKRITGLLAGAIALVVAFLFFWPWLRPRVWQMAYGKTYRDSRFTMNLNRNWLVVTGDYGHQSLVRPFAYWPPMIDVDRLTLHQSEQCPDPDQDAKENFRKVIGGTLLNSLRYSNKSEFVIHTKAGDLLCLSSAFQVKSKNMTSTYCLLQNDSTIIAFEGMDPVREEVLSMLPTLTQIRSCTAKH